MGDDREQRPAAATSGRDKEREERSKHKSSRRHRSRSSSRSRSRSRDRSRRSRSKDRDRRRDRRSRSRSRDSRGRRRRSTSRDNSRSRKDHDSAPMRVQRMWQQQQLAARQMVLQQQALAAKSTATKVQREVYVGNLVPGAITEPMLTQIFNTALMVRFPGSNVPGTEPVIKSSIHKDGRYAFVEFRTPDMATAALDLSGQVQFLGQAISVNRPSGYVDPLKISAAAAAATSTMHAFQAATLPGMGAAGVSPLFSATPSAFPGMAPGMVPGALPGVALPGPPAMPYGMPVAAPAAAAPAAASLPAICINGMVGVDVLVSDLEYAEVLDDLKSECETHAPGAVLQVKVPRPPQPELAAQQMGTGNYGKAFVLFSSAAAAEKAKAAINGRMFSGRTLHVDLVSQDAFASV